MAVEIGEEWDPGAHDYGQNTTDDGRLLGQMMGLTALSAFALIGVGAFFTYAAVEAGIALDVSFTLAPTSGIGGLAAYCEGTALTEGQIVILSQMEALAINEEMGGGVLTALTLCAESWGLETFSVESLIATATWQPLHMDSPMYGYFGGYLGNFRFGDQLPGGGLTDPPGFPGFPGHGYPIWDPNAGGTGFFCVKINDEYMCHWEY